LKEYFIIWNNLTDDAHYAYGNGLGPVLYPDYDMAKRRLGQLSGQHGKYFKIDGNRCIMSGKKAALDKGFQPLYKIVRADVLVQEDTPL